MGVLTFSAPATVQFSYGLTGTLFNTDPTGFSIGGGSVDVYDVTGLTTLFKQVNGEQLVSDEVEVHRIPDSSVAGSFVAYGNQFDTSELDPLPTTVLSLLETQDGSPQFVNHVLTGSVGVLPDHFYLIQLTSLAGIVNPASQPAGADFSRTAKFEFTDLDGSTYVSSAGALWNNVTPVPEPSSALLLFIGLAGYVLWHRRSFRLA